MGFRLDLTLAIVTPPTLVLKRLEQDAFRHPRDQGTARDGPDVSVPKGTIHLLG